MSHQERKGTLMRTAEQIVTDLRQAEDEVKKATTKVEQFREELNKLKAFVDSAIGE